jgi:long-chain acyl-CoA synthetase
VTAAGVNLHPEDLEAAIEQEPGVAGCAVVPMETASGTEPCAVLAMRGSGDGAASAIERANQRLAEFQRLRRWVLWPEPDLPRTSTGKVRRKVVEAWLAEIQAAAAKPRTNKNASTSAFGASSDWLLALIAQISGEAPSGVGDELRLTEDLHLDSLSRVQLAASLEERLGMSPESGLLEEVQTLGELRVLVAGKAEGARAARTPAPKAEEREEDEAPSLESEQTNVQAPGKYFRDDAMCQGTTSFVPQIRPMERAALQAPEKRCSVSGHDFSRAANAAKSTGALAPEEKASPIAPFSASAETAPARYIYPHWPWLPPIQWLRVAFVEALMRPLVGLLANPKVVAPETLHCDEPMLIVSNHVTTFDGPLVQYALPEPVRRRIAAAMAGDMLEDYRHFRNPERARGRKEFYLPGPLIYLLLTALFNVFPLPRWRNFQRSFEHAGEALDRGYNVLVFPEGARSAEGTLARFRGGIGLLTKESGTLVLPVAIRGLGELKAGDRRWFRSGKIEVHVGQPIRFALEETEAEITARLHAEVDRLLNG